MSDAALAELYDQHGTRLYRYALMLLGGDVGAAEDSVQDAFCQLARAARRDPGLVSAAYLTTIVRNECFSALRRRRRQLVPAAVLEPPALGSSEEERLMLDGALRALPPAQREVIYLKVFEGLTFQQIGERCGISLNTAASRYRYALAALRTSLEIGGSNR